MKSKNFPFGIVTIFLLLSFIPPIVLSRLQSEDAYWYMVFPVIKIYQLIGHLDIHSYISGQNSFIIILSNITGIKIDILQFMPVSGLILPILVFVLIRKISNSDIIAAIYSFYYGFNLTNSSLQYSVSPVELSVLLFFTYLILLYSAIQKSRNANITILLLIIFTAIHFTYYSIEFWTTGLMIFINLIYIISYYFNLDRLKPVLSTDMPTFKRNYFKLSGSDILEKGMSSLTLALIILFFTFNQIFYEGFIKRLITFETPARTIQWIYLKLSPLFGKNTPHLGYEYIPVNHINDYIVILQLAILTILLCMLTLKGTRQIIRGSQAKNTNFYFALSLIGVIVLDISVYFLRGFLSIRSIYYLAPISILLLMLFNYGNIEKSNKAFKINIMFISTISLIVAVSFIVSYNTGFTYYSQYDKVAPSGEWYEEHVKSDRSALTDLNTFYKFELLSVNSSKNHKFVFYDNQNYEKLINGNATKKDFDFCVIDSGALDKMVVSETPENDWMTYQPISYYYPKIENNFNINKIYASSIIEIWSINYE